MYRTSWYYQRNDISSLATHCDEFTQWIEDKLNSYDVIDWKIQKDMIRDSDNYSYHVWVLIMNCRG